MRRLHPAKPLLAMPLVLVLGIGGAAAAGLGTANDALDNVPSPADAVVPTEVPAQPPAQPPLPVDAAGPQVDALSVEGTEEARDRIEEILETHAPSAAETGLELAWEAVGGAVPVDAPPVDVPPVDISGLTSDLDDIISELPVPEPPAGPGLPELPDPPVGRP